MNDSSKELEDQIEAVKTKEVLTALKRSEGWNILMDILKVRHERLINEVLYRCLDDTNSVHRQEFNKGQAYMLKFLMNMPDGLLEEAEAIIGINPQDEDEVDAD